MISSAMEPGQKGKVMSKTKTPEYYFVISEDADGFRYAEIHKEPKTENEEIVDSFGNRLTVLTVTKAANHKDAVRNLVMSNKALLCYNLSKNPAFIPRSSRSPDGYRRK